MIVSELALARIADQAGGNAELHRACAADLTRALVARLWDDDTGLFLVRDLLDDRLIPELSVAGLIPLLVPGLPEHIVERLTHALQGPHFQAKSTALIPSYDLSGRYEE